MTRLTPEQVAEIRDKRSRARCSCFDIDALLAHVEALEHSLAAREAECRVKARAIERISALEADLAACRRAIQDAINYANGRESEWGDRAEGAFAFLYAALSAQSGKGASHGDKS